ncbi:TetR/AcrR family transcriptional regulator [Muribaculaceae bacterium Isolate-104 (HZI)]|nr:TetR/AcrR family transcriptional regulator [Muribaculaceae bacterium Isolate-104 (HZI)]
MVLKTREKLIEVARQLFAHKGVENTTMNDIAAASDKGRRTIYTYFKNKREIYNAVIERESDNIVEKLREVQVSNLPPEEKLKIGLKKRFEIIAQLSTRQDSIRTLFIRDIRRIERIRRLASSKETEILNSILDEGVKTNVFDPDQAKRLPALTSLLFQGTDYFNLKADSDEKANAAMFINDSIDYIVQGILLK